MLAVIVGKILILLVAISHGWAGAIWHVGYTVISRSTFGIWGSYLALLQRIVLCTVWYSVQSYTAGQCLSVLLSAIFPSFFRLRNTLPESLHMDTKQIISFFLYHLISIPFLLIAPENLKHPFKIISVVSALAIFGTSIGSMVHAHGAGPLLHAKQPDPVVHYEALGMAFVHAVNAVINSLAVGLSNQPDFSRFVQRPGKQIWGQTVSILILGNVVPLFGLLGTSAASASYGDITALNLWNPPAIIGQWLLEAYTPRSRCAAFFAAFGFLVSTLGLNTVDNGISGGMDLAGVWPRYINIRRGTFIIAVLSIAIQPWYLLQSASVFLNVLSSYGLFLGPMIGVFTSDYFLVRRQRLKLSDLYRLNYPRNIYWYLGGFNWRAYTAWVCGFLPGITGVASVNNKMVDRLPTASVRMFHISFIVGYAIAFLMHWALSRVFPPDGNGEYDEVDMFGTFTESEARKLDVIPRDAIIDNSSEWNMIETEDMDTKVVTA